jgi:hypothetical protein
LLRSLGRVGRLLLMGKSASGGLEEAGARLNESQRPERGQKVSKRPESTSGGSRKGWSEG